MNAVYDLITYRANKVEGFFATIFLILLVTIPMLIYIAVFEEEDGKFGIVGIMIVRFFRFIGRSKGSN